ncbi:MAG: AMP-binding protein, partial [Acidimicrobiia bacterium]|nr:AMP-binding protein [Acidimicrobiia bacterium]
RAAAKSLIALGVEPGAVVTILGANRPEWTIIDVAAMAAGAVPAGIYATNSPAECRYIVEHSAAPIVVVENQAQWEKIAQVRDQIPNLRHVVTMRGADPIDDEMVLSWDAFMAAGADVGDEVLQERMDNLDGDTLATLIYTSGTTGPPKGVMLSHDNLVWTPAQVVGPLRLDPDDRVLSYLPLSHIAEQLFTIHAPATVGFPVYYAESIEKLADNLKEVEPTLFFAVPRVWERFHAGVEHELAKAHGAKAKILAWARGVGARVVDLRHRGQEPSGMLGAQFKVADRLVFSKTSAALGLGKARAMISGAAPLATEIKEFFAGLNIPIYEVYGQSEGSGPTSINLPGRTKLATVGPAYPNVVVKIADDGEVLVKGRNVFMGYYREPEATAETLKDGWLYSGDLGEFDADGYLSITGRKKDIIITAGGKNVAPKPLESGLRLHPLISEAVVIGDRRKFLSVLLTLDEEAAAAHMAERGESGPAHTSESISKEVQAAIDELNKDFARVEQLKRFVILPRQLSIEGGELTPTLKVKRNKVTEHFADEIESMYAD